MSRLRLAVLALIALVPPAHADDWIEIRLSFKSILRPVTGIPAGPSELSLDQAIDRLNEDMLRNNAVYRFVRVDPIIQVGDPDNDERPNPSHYNQFNQFQTRAEMQSDALANQALWAWNPTAVNVYFNLHGGTNCPYPCGQLILIQELRGDVDNEYYLHEIGDYFNLCKTHGCGCDECRDGGVGACMTEPGNDGISDTLPDAPAWDRDDIAQFSFGVNFDQLSPSNQELVLNVYHNALSNRSEPFCRHDVFENTNRLTEGQLDRWADAASTTRASVCDGRVFYVMAGAGGSQNGRSTNPFDRVAEGLAAANGGGDIVLIRDGAYPENLTISAPVTLCAPRGHTARIGTPP